MNKATLIDWLLNRQIHEYSDTSGRPIGEGRSEAYQQVETQFRSCPYPGSRHQHAQPMNFSALQCITPEWRRIVSLLGWLGQRYRTYNQCEVTGYYDLARISGMGIFLADYMALRRVNPLQPGEVPVLLSGLYKVCLGFQQVTFLAMMNDIFQDGETTELPDAAGFYRWLEDNKLLIGEAEVCGGSEMMISKAYEAMCGIGQPIPADITETLPELATFEIDWDAYDQFAANSSNLWRKAIQFIIQMKGFGIHLDTPYLEPDLREQLNDWFERQFNKLLDKQSGLTVDIAALTLSESEHTPDEWLVAGTAFLDEINYVEPDQASPQMTRLLEQIAQATQQQYDLDTEQQVLVRQIIEQQLARYHAYESAILQAFNTHLTQISQALDNGTDANENLAAIDLSNLFGVTLRDWPD